MMKEKTNPKSVAPHKVKGTVLFTVVCVMMVLIVFLLSTLALATTANKRAQTRFQKEQSEYRARAIIDSVVDVMNQTRWDATHDNGDGTVGAAVDRYSIKSGMLDLDPVSKSEVDWQDKAMTLQVTVDGVEYPVTIRNTGNTRDLYVDSEWTEVSVYEMQVDLRSDTTAANTTYTAYITGRADGGAGGGSGGGSGGFVSFGPVENNIGTGGWLTGGSFMGVGATIDRSFKVSGNGALMIDGPAYINSTFEINDSAPLTLHITGPMNKTRVAGRERRFPTLAIMGDLDLNNSELECEYIDGMTSLGAIDYEDVPSVYVGGLLNGALNNNDGLALGKDGIPVNVFAGQFNLRVQNGHGSGIHGDLYGFDPNVTNVICGRGNSTKLYSWAASNIKKSGSTEIEKFGNLYSAGNLEIASGSEQHIDGSVRCDKSVVINCKTNIGGNLVAGATLTVNQDVTVKGNVYAAKVVHGDKLHMQAGKKIYCFEYDGPPSPHVEIVSTAGLTPHTQAAWYTDGTLEIVRDTWCPANKMQRKYTLTKHVMVGGVEQTSIVTNAWPANMDSVWFNSGDAEFMADPNYAAIEAEYNNLAAHNSESNAITESFYSIEETFKLIEGAEAIYPPKYVKANMPDAVFDEPEATDFTSQYITTPEQLPASVYNSSTHSFNVTTYNITTGTLNNADVEFTPQCKIIKKDCILTGGEINGNVLISGATTVIFKDLALNAAKTTIVVDDTRPVTIFLMGKCGFGNLFTIKYMDALGITLDQVKNGSNLSSSNQLSGLTIPQNTRDWRYPKVTICGEAGSGLVVSNNSSSPDPHAPATTGNSLVTANIKAPYTDFAMGLAPESSGVTYVYSTGPYAVTKTKIKNFAVIGQLVAKDINAASDRAFTVLYVTDGGGPRRIGVGMYDNPSPFEVMSYDVY